MNKDKKINREIEKLELELQVQELKMKLQKAAELNRKRTTYGKRNNSKTIN